MRLLAILPMRLLEFYHPFICIFLLCLLEFYHCDLHSTSALINARILAFYQLANHNTYLQWLCTRHGTTIYAYIASICTTMPNRASHSSDYCPNLLQLWNTLCKIYLQYTFSINFNIDFFTTEVCNLFQLSS